MKAKNIQKNPHVCLVVYDSIKYEQCQLYATAKIVDNPVDFVPFIEKTIAKQSEKTDYFVPPMEIGNEGSVIIIELTPIKIKSFKSGQGLSEQNL